MSSASRLYRLTCGESRFRWLAPATDHPSQLTFRLMRQPYYDRVAVTNGLANGLTLDAGSTI
jgi:hypothetical protein